MHWKRQHCTQVPSHSLLQEALIAMKLLDGSFELFQLHSRVNVSGFLWGPNFNEHCQLQACTGYLPQDVANVCLQPLLVQGGARHAAPGSDLTAVIAQCSGSQ